MYTSSRGWRGQGAEGGALLKRIEHDAARAVRLQGEGGGVEGVAKAETRSAGGMAGPTCHFCLTS